MTTTAGATPTTQVRHNNIEITLPEAGWSDLTTITMKGPTAGRYSAGVAISSVLTKCSTVAEVVEGELPKLKKAFKEFKLVTQGPAEFGANKGHVLEFEGVLNGARLRQLQFFVLKQGVSYTVSFAHAATAFEASRASFNDILKTVKV